MERKVRLAQYGCGLTGAFLMRYAIEHGAELVAAFDVNPQVIGKDVGEMMGTEPIGLKISDAQNAEAILKETKPDVCIIATRSTMADLQDAFSLCAKNGINAISTCEEAIYPWNSSHKITSELDKLAKENRCTLSGSGFPDMFWGSLVTTLAGSMHKAKKLTGFTCYDIDESGIALAEGHGAGLTVEEFNKTIGEFNNLNYAETLKAIEDGTLVPAYSWNQCGWLCSHFGLHITSQLQRCLPVIAPADMFSKTLNATIKAGNVIGMSANVTAETEEGITIEIQSKGFLYGPDDFHKAEWTFTGEPDMTVTINRPANVELTCSTLINRIPMLIDAQPGYITTEKLPVNHYLARPMNEYIKTM